MIDTSQVSSKQCPVCSSRTSLTIWSKENFQLYQFPLKATEAKRSFRMDLILHFCEQCHHAYLWPTPDDATLNTFYASGYTAFTSPLATGGLETSIIDPACEFIVEEVNRRFKRPVRIAEVGGFDGYVLTRLASVAGDRLLIEGSEAGAAVARRHGVPVLEAFLDEGLAQHLGQKFDVVISRHVIEHVREPIVFVRQLATLLAPDGILVIETPDLTWVLDRVQVRTVMLQHLHLFSPRSLRLLMVAKCGLGIDRIAFLPSGAVIVSATKHPEVSEGAEELPSRTIEAESVVWANAIAFARRLETQNSKLTGLINEWTERSKRIWVWGAGTAGGELFNVYGQRQEHFQGYIDSNESKAEMRFASAPELPICTPERAYEIGVDSVLIASFSVGEILHSIRQRGWDVEVADIYTGEKRSLKQ
jgi:SAM-dependent methyltransferase